MKNLIGILLCFSIASTFTSTYGQSSEEIEARYVQSVVVAAKGSTSSIGDFEEVTYLLWESFINGQSISYRELARDQWSIYLKADNEDKIVTLNLESKMVFVGGVQKYSILESSADVIPDAPTSAPVPEFEIVSTNYYQIEDGLHKQVVLGGDAFNGRIYHQPLQNRDNGRWQFISAGDGYYHIIDVKHGKALVAGDNANNSVYHQDPEGRDNAKWKLEPVGDGSFHITDKKHNKSLVAGTSYDGNIYHQTPQGRKNATWRLTVVGAETENVATTPPVDTTPPPVVKQAPPAVTDPNNIALHRPSKHSSQYGSEAKNGPHLANDGIVQNEGQGGLLHHTDKEKNPWWEVDLEGYYDILNITLHNRTNCCPERLNNFTILVSVEPFTGNFGGTTFIANEPAPNGSKMYFPTAGKAVGRYVRVFTNQTDYMSIPEITIAGMFPMPQDLSAAFEANTATATTTTTTTTPVVTTPPPPVDNTATNKSQITDYIRSLSYNAQDLLAVKPEGSFETFPPGGVTERKAYGNKVIKCVKKSNTADEKLDKVSILNPNAGVIFPGALILGDRKLADGLPTPITFERAPIVLSVDLPGMTQGVTIQNPVNSEVQNGINGMLQTWNSTNGSTGYKNVGKIYKKYQKAYSSEQLAIDLGFNVKWAQGEASLQTKFDGSSEQDVTVAFFRQVYYTVTMDAPTRPSDVFDASKVTKDDVASRFNNQKPPAYVRSVDYGRLVMVRMETSKKSLASELEGALEVALDPTTKIDGELKTKYEGIWENSLFTVYIMGGGATDAAEFAGGSGLSGLQDLINAGASYSPANAGVPVAYTVAWLKDNEHAGIRVSTNYTETECTEYDNATIKLVHNGAYVARVKVTWSEPNAQGVLETKVKDYGHQTTGWTQTHNFPGDAENIQILAEAATGLVWAPWGEIMNEHLTGPSNCTYRMHGTTLDRKFEVKDCQ